MARWILENPNPAPRIAHTIIAGWWPTIYYMVGTIEHLIATGDGPMERLIRSLNQAAQDEYVVQVFKTNQQGVPKTSDPYYERSFHTRKEAIDAHHEAVKLLAAGRLRLK